MRIDAHQHFWTTSRTDYGWLTPELGDIYRDFLPSNLAPLLQETCISGTVLVQAAPTVEETEYLLGLADQNAFIKGVVGWVDLERPDAGETLQRLNAHPKFVGVRPMIQDIADADWMLKDTLTPAFEAIIAEGLVFDALTLPIHLKNLRRLLDKHSEMRVVIDHASKPYIRDQVISEWADDMDAIARNTNAYCKFSGIVTEASASWNTDDLRPYTDHLLAAFGPNRLIWGSDWPVCTLASSYQRWWSATEELLAQLKEEEKNSILGLNAVRLYGLDV